MGEKSPFTLAGVMGWPVAHSRSPLIHNHWIARHGLQGAYGLFAVEPKAIEAALRGLVALGIAGCNVTIPHKVRAMELMDHVDPLAKRIGAINTIVVQRNGELHGFNNDGFGFIQSLKDAMPHWSAKTGPAVVLGAGGAARAVILSLLDQGAQEIRLLNRTLEKAQQLVEEFAGLGPYQGRLIAHPWHERHGALAGAALLVNTTNQGMHGQSALALTLDDLPTQALVFDAIYIPLETPFLESARLRGNTTVNGLGMLLNQARPAFEAWFGVNPEITPELRHMIVATL